MFYKPSYLARTSGLAKLPTLDINPSPIQLIEPVVAQGEVVYAGADPEIDIVMSGSELITLTIQEVE